MQSVFFVARVSDKRKLSYQNMLEIFFLETHRFFYFGVGKSCAARNDYQFVVIVGQPFEYGNALTLELAYGVRYAQQVAIDFFAVATDGVGNKAVIYLVNYVRMTRMNGAQWAVDFYFYGCVEIFFGVHAVNASAIDFPKYLRRARKRQFQFRE